MRALSLRNPHAWAVAHAGKRLENRRWGWLKKGFAAFAENGPIASERIAIHASRTRPSSDDLAVVGRACRPLAAQGLPPEATTGGAIVATCRVVDVVRAAEPLEVIGGSAEWPVYRMDPRDFARLIGLGHWSTPEADAARAADQVDRWWLGPYALVLGEVAPLRDPVRCSGARGFWTVPHDVERIVRIAEDRVLRRDQEVEHVD